MDSATISALAALSGAVIVGVTSFGTSWLSQQTQARSPSGSYAAGRLYALVGMMRVISSTPVVESANHVVRLIANSYVAKKGGLPQLD